MGWLSLERWSPYVVGAGIGVLSWVTFLFSNKPIGCSTTYSRASGMVERALRGSSVAQRPYYQEHQLVIDWQWMFVLGIGIGAFLSSVLSSSFSFQWIPAMWSTHISSSVVLRLSVAALGGMVMGFGARWAKGCTSGHGISGTMQLAVSSWIAVICFFMGGIIMAHIIYVWME
jgi:uncharacterized membrane protein YedE/YeeE